MSTARAPKGEQTATAHALRPGERPVREHCGGTATAADELHFSNPKTEEQCSCHCGSVGVPNGKHGHPKTCTGRCCDGSSALMRKAPMRKSSKAKKARPGRLKEGSLAWEEQRAAAITRSRAKCEAAVHPQCASNGEHLHHVQLRSRGGSDYQDNLLHVCHACHGWIHAHPAAATERGLMRHGYGGDA